MRRQDPLGEALREVSLPAPDDAEARGLRVVEAAYAERRGVKRGDFERRPSLARLALALALAALLAGLTLSPAGAAVRDWVDDVFTASTPLPEPTLGDVPGGGRLLVQSAAGPWVVQPDGSRRLLGDYEEATWSPRGLFVAVAEGRTLSAVEPDGTPHWSITAPGRVGDPRWSPSRYRIAYRSDGDLRVVAADGTGDHPIGEAAPAAPAWSPLGSAELAYVDPTGFLQIADSESGESLASAPAGTNVTELEWGAGGSLILEVSSQTLRLQSVRPLKLAARPGIEFLRELPLPAGTSLVDAALAPRRPLVAAVVTRWREHGTRSSVVVYGAGGERARRLLTVPGSLGEVAWSPDGRRLLVAWPASDQWLFLPLGRGRPRAVANVSVAFSPGGRSASFPRLEGWCCR
jgi:WD40-like Beta Propeller Repeat